MKPYQPSFFDESERLAALSRLKYPLEEFAKHIDCEMFRPLLTEVLRCTPDRKSPAGRKPLDVILMFKALIIQRLFNFSDEQLEYQITGRFFLTCFLGLHIGETIPNCTRFWGFREALAVKGLERPLFDHFAAKLEAEEVLPKSDRSSVPRLGRFRARKISRQFHADFSSQGKTFVPHQMKSDRLRQRFGSVKKIPPHGIRHRFPKRIPIIALSDDRFRQALGHKPAIALLNHFEN
jgi:hypothetical protein